MYCSHCGKEIGDGLHYCNYCGEPQGYTQQISTQSLSQDASIPQGRMSKTRGLGKFIAIVAAVLTLGIVVTSLLLVAYFIDLPEHDEVHDADSGRTVSLQDAFAGDIVVYGQYPQGTNGEKSPLAESW